MCFELDKSYHKRSIIFPGCNIDQFCPAVIIFRIDISIILEKHEPIYEADGVVELVRWNQFGGVMFERRSLSLSGNFGRLMIQSLEAR